MPQVYTVATRNPFAALDDSESEDAILARPAEGFQQQQQQSPSSQPAPPQRPKSKNGERKPQRRNDQPRQPSAVAETAEAAPAKNPKNPKPARRAPPREGNVQGRVFDRQSGTGRGREMKKEGGGAHNWGNEPDDFGAEGENKQSAQPTATPAEAAAPGSPEQPAAEEQVTEGGTKIVSYTAYKEMMARNAPAPKAETTETEDLERQKIQEGYQVYRKESSSKNGNVRSKRSDDEDDEKRPKTVHLAELAAQTGMGLRYQRAPRSDEGKKAKGGDQQQRSHEINLSDNQAFPELEAH